MNKQKSLKEMLQEGAVVAPGCHDALGARIIESAGFDAVSISGYGVSASLMGKPDVGLLTMTEMVQVAGNIASAVNIPVICDADTGYGNVNNVIRCVEEFEAVGVSAISLEDQVMPKRCGLEEGVGVISLDEYLVKLRGALHARKNDDFLIVARTDARNVYGLDEAIKRGKAFVETGADIVFVEGIETIEEAKQVKSAIPDIPLQYVNQENTIYPYMNNSEIEELGYKLVKYPICATLLYAKEVLALMKHINNNGSAKDYSNRLMDEGDFGNLIGLPEVRKRENELMK